MKVEGILLFLVGIYCTLIGFRVISASKKQGPEYDAWHKKWGLLLKIAGPIMIMAGIARSLLK